MQQESHGSAFGDVKDRVRDVYRSVNTMVDGSALGRYSMFLNYGYLGNAADISTRILPRRVLHHHSVALLIEAVGGRDLTGARVLEVGCGRGGNVRALKRYCGASDVVGVDLSEEAIRFCQATISETGLRFEVGDAENMTFDDQSFHAVLNIESSHSYPDIFRFYAEVARVLQPDGWFFYADLLPREMQQPCLEALRQLGFNLELDRDITANVLRSRDAQAAETDSLFFAAENAPVREFLGLPGSGVYEDLKSGRLVYTARCFRKTGAAAARQVSDSPENALLQHLVGDVRRRFTELQP